jgi:hypothetical protein
MVRRRGIPGRPTWAEGTCIVEVTSGSAPLRPRARLLHTIGTEPISSERVAVVELVKNAYDADADRVVIRLVGPLERGKGRLEVLDDGHGMSADTVRETWLEVATPHRSRNSRSQDRGRRVLGEKGIGRFAASRLADQMALTSRPTSSGVEVALHLNWDDFRDPDKYLDEVPLDWKTRAPQVFAPEGEALIFLISKFTVPVRPHLTPPVSK